MFHCTATQVIAYNKMDLPDASDYLDEVMDYMKARGLPAEDVVAISAVTGRGVTDLVRRVRARLDELPEEVGLHAIRILTGTVDFGD
jgi:50S ribosomal subunit-associated GTPase HflX